MRPPKLRAADEIFWGSDALGAPFRSVRCEARTSLGKIHGSARNGSDDPGRPLRPQADRNRWRRYRGIRGWFVDRLDPDPQVGDERAHDGHLEASPERRTRDSQRTRLAIRVLGVKPEGERGRPCAVNGLGWLGLRQRHDGELLGPNAGRAAEPEEMEDQDRAREPATWLHRGLPQHPPSAQLPEYAHPS